LTIPEHLGLSVDRPVEVPLTDVNGTETFGTDTVLTESPILEDPVFSEEPINRENDAHDAYSFANQENRDEQE
jgi:hypothetical protein